MDKNKIAMTFFGALLLFGVFMIIVSLIGPVTGQVTEGTTSSNVTIATYFAIQFSTNLTEGINFGTVNEIPVDDINSTGSYVFDKPDTNGTTYYVNVSTDSNTAVDFCLSANSDLTSSGGDTIGLANQTYSNSSINNRTFPLIDEEISFTTSYVKASAPTAIGSGTYYRFWLDIPAATAAASYNNTVQLKGVQTTLAC